MRATLVFGSRFAQWSPQCLLVLLAVLAVAIVSAVDSTDAAFSFVDVSYTESHTLVFDPSKTKYRYVGEGSERTDNEVVAVVVDRNPKAPGWDFIRFAADEAFVAQNQSEAFYAVGYAEGFLVADSIYSSFVTSMTEYGLPWKHEIMADGTSVQWLSAHLTFMRNLSYTNTSAYGVMVKSLLRQIDGLYDGYTAAVGPASQPRQERDPQPLTWTEMFLISFQAEIIRANAAGDVLFEEDANTTVVRRKNVTGANVTRPTNSPARQSNAAKPPTNATRVSDLSPMRVRSADSHCSALIRFTGNDILVGHDTWSSFNTMGSRQYKTYTFGTSMSVTMSSYPASLASVDDFFITQSKLSITETSLSVATDQLDHLVDPESVSEFIRAMLANYLAENGPEWAALFSEYNSGTYNNQYMILDTKLAEHHLTDELYVYKTLPPNTFWVLEQAPGLIIASDQTAFLNKQKYFPSYSIPFYHEIAEYNGYNNAANLTGSLANYMTDARARLFKRLIGTVTDVEGMYRIMRHNDWQHDEESIIFWCATQQYGPCKQNRSALLSIAARGDLAPAPGNGGPAVMGRLPFAEMVELFNLGATDTKVTSVRNMMGEYIGYAINGPTSQGQPNFNRTEFILANTDANGSRGMLEGVNWRGVPEYFDFPVVRFVTEALPKAQALANSSASSTAEEKPHASAATNNSGSATAIVVGLLACAVVLAASVFAHRRWFSRKRNKLYEGEDTPLV